MNANDHAVKNVTHMLSEGNVVPGFDPLKLLIATPDGPRLTLPYKKLWFHKKHLNGRIRLSPLRITDQLAIIEASVFLDRKDAEPASSYIAEVRKEDAPHGRYIEAAQDFAIEQALSNAGFDVQFIPVSQTEQAAESRPTIKQEAPPKPPVQESIPIAAPVSKTESASAPAAATPPQSVIEPKEEFVEKEQPAPQAASPGSILSAVQRNEEVRPVEKAASQPAMQLDDFEEILPDEDEQPQEASAAPAYTQDMPVDKICSLMSLDEARNYTVKEGACSGWTLAQVEERRPASLKFYVKGYSGKDNILRAGATLLLSAAEAKAS